MKANQILEELKKEKFNYYGLRMASQSDLDNLERGYLDRSYDWYDGESTGEQLEGTCAIEVNQDMDNKQIEEIIERLQMYATETSVILLVADSRSEYGNDDGEIILGHDGFGADIVAVIE